MNNKESKLYEVVDIVVSCCATQIDEIGTMSVTRDDVLGKSRAANVNMTRCILVTQLLFLGFSTSTAASLLHRTEPAIRHLLDAAHQFRVTSFAYRIAEAEATLKCKELLAGK